ncbi:IS607 family element RNA-guided endonuclease TnpB [Saccharopolyspora terrae]|uniref:IS607 family element RNA-guided endonuclease TnpB n=1 Tax=Saccharopolyspora terrae TaxID=2530384 RepID=UPI001F42DC1F|nr:IS607 family element RNA-guided endonuclease TnpB [Saccharopolyspora terrae]
MTTLIQAYRFALDPNPAQEEALRSHCGAQRFAYNWGLRKVKANMDQRKAEASYGIAEEDLISSLSWSAYSLRKDWNQAKNDIAPWWPENSKEAYSSGLANLAAGLKNWNDSKTGKRRGSKVAFPRFKSKHRTLSCRFTTGSFGLVDHDRRHVKLPRIGTVRTHESTRKLARRVDACSARIRSATVSFRSGRWFVSFSVEVDRDDPPPANPDSAVGVDLGIKSLAVLSTGEVIANPKHLELAQRELRRLQRQAARRLGPDKRTRQQPSKRWYKTSARITKLHAKIADARRDGMHKLTSRLVCEHGAIVLEDLNVKGMMSNRRLARHLAGVGMGEFRHQVEYKAAWSGVHTQVVNRWYPSSKTCSSCGAVKTKLHLSERVYQCERCGMVLDRDLNAALNLVALVERESSSASCVVRLNESDGNPRKPNLVGHGYRHGKTPAHVGRGQRQRGNALTQ